MDGATAAGLTLRRLGTEPGVGYPPAPAAGLTGVEFLIASLDPQIEEASFDLNRRFGIDPNVAGRSPADVYDLRDLRQACVLTVLAQRYAAETRGDQGDFALKLTQVRQELSEVLARLTLRWGGAARTDNPPTGSAHASSGSCEVSGVGEPTRHSLPPATRNSQP